MSRSGGKAVINLCSCASLVTVENSTTLVSVLNMASSANFVPAATYPVSTQPVANPSLLNSPFTHYPQDL